jgi:glycine dehydrogenase subunit 1
MAARLTGRSHVLVPATMSPERLAVIRTYCGSPELAGYVEVELVGHDTDNGGLDLDDLRAKLSERTAAVLFENPGFLGPLEQNAAEIASLARAAGAETIVGVDPISLGIVAPPSEYGADIVVGSVQPLGVHMSGGGGAGGFIATRDEERYAREYPTLNLSIGRTVEGEYGFGIALFEQTSYGLREDGNDWTGNSVYLHAVANAAYMALMGPEGFAEVGRLIVGRSHYAARRLGELDGVRILFPDGFFKEFVVAFDETGKTVADVNRGLLARGIFGGKDLSRDFPQLGQSALYCVTEVHTREDVDRLVEALKEVLA